MEMNDQKKKFLMFNLFGFLCLALMLCLNIKVYAAEKESEEIKKSCTNIINLASKNKNDKFIGVDFENLDKASNFLIDFESSNTKEDSIDNEETLTAYTDVCDEEISKSIEKYKEEQRRIEEERRRAQQQARAISDIQNRGSYGRLTIEGTGVDVALFRSSFSDENNQAIVDRQDSAFIGFDFQRVIVADHTNQGFNRMKKSVPGVTKAYINRGDFTETYICTANFKGHNTGSDITDLNYNSYLNNGSELLMYTCNENWQNITITLWKKI